ncbi:venom carboxylesterase-6-like isoform X2 [Bacillus rossius redtenbacheri]|uniref:venom carboxylesterase-6-like isoform X2 n=1 Tax=Bacillus rossius redtenbacheri TaxID=93214 RepID=UPI002FDD5C62
MRTLLLLAVCVAGAAASYQDRPVVRVEQGAAAGSFLRSAKGRRYAAFQGMPYARARARFQEAEPAEAWDGVWPADEPGSECLQYMHTHGDHEQRVRGSEDCLFVNVFTPQLPNGTNPALDVIVFIHGGAFMFGSGDTFGPRYFMDRDVVFVTFNYRLGILGFLSTEDEVAPGNNGLKDQVLALRWVQRNIAVFGGDAGSVTLMGMSAGGASVHLHYLSPLSRGLFHRGISVSGTALCPWVLAESLRAKAELMAAALGCSVASSRHVVDCLSSRPARKVVGLTSKFQEFLYNPFSPFGPTVEAGGARAFLPRHPVDVLGSGQARDLPWVTSVTTHEGLYPAADLLRDDAHIRELDRRFEELAPHLLDFNHTVPAARLREVSRRVRAAYLGARPISRETMPAVVEMVGDRLFVVDAVLAARLQASVNRAPVFFYQFGYRGEDSLSEWMTGDGVDYGCCHADDMGFVTQVFFSDPEQTAGDRQMTQLLLDFFVSFARTGRPGLDGAWEPVDAAAEGLGYLAIAGPHRVEQRHSADLGRAAFWLSLGLRERRTAPPPRGDEL